TPIPEHAAPVGGATPLEEVFPEERLRSILGAPPAPGTGVHLPASETQDEVSQAFDWMADQPQPAAPVSAGATVQAPEVAAGFAQQHLALLGSLLARPLTGSEIAVLGQVWSSVANPGDLARLAAGNSRRLFNNHRNRFWRAVRQDPAARQLLTDAGFSFGPGLTSAPTYLLPNGNRVQVTIDHIVERQTDPGRALDPGNLRLSFRRENTVVLRLLHQLDPFQRHP
ncbi:MAG: hypothetical protein JXB85_15455, partial [Anaerolineales bacterium]|nr:hypothetical protein [Anaerolineales bacterium]